jgi:hypothetical protein
MPTWPPIPTYLTSLQAPKKLASVSATVAVLPGHTPVTATTSQTSSSAASKTQSTWPLLPDSAAISDHDAAVAALDQKPVPPITHFTMVLLRQYIENLSIKVVQLQQMGTPRKTTCCHFVSNRFQEARRQPNGLVETLERDMHEADSQPGILCQTQNGSL